MKKKLSYQDKYKILAFMYRRGDVFDTCNHFKINKEQLVRLASIYEKGGIEAIKGKKYIDYQTKADALREVIALQVPIKHVSCKYKINSGVIRYWLKGSNIDITNLPKHKHGAEAMRNSLLFTAGCNNATVLYEGKTPRQVREMILEDNPEVLYRYTALDYIRKKIENNELTDELIVEAIDAADEAINKLREKLSTGEVR